LGNPAQYSLQRIIIRHHDYHLFHGLDKYKEEDEGWTQAMAIFRNKYKMYGDTMIGGAG
jgi:hypothetical protein